MSPKALFYYFCFCGSLFIAVFSFFFFVTNIYLQFLGSSSGLISATAIFLLVIINLPGFQKKFSPILSAFNWIKKAEMASIVYNIQGNLNQFRETVNKETPDLIPEAEVEWVTDVDTESFFDEYKGKVIIRMKKSKDNAINLAKASLIQVNKGVIPESRMYIEKKMNLSIDLSLVKKILIAQGEKAAYRYFLNEITIPELSDKDVLNYLSKIEIMDEAGFFTRLFLRELKEFPVLKGFNIRNISIIRDEIKRFFEYTEIVATRKPQERIPLEFEGSQIKTSIIYVAIYGRMAAQGTKPYIKRALINRKKGHELIFFISFKHAIDFTRKILTKLVKNYGMELIKNSDVEYSVDNEPYLCATVLTNPSKSLRPQDDDLFNELLKDIVNETVNETGWAYLDSVELKIKQKIPYFDEKDYGFSSFKKLTCILDSFDVKEYTFKDQPSLTMIRFNENKI